MRTKSLLMSGLAAALLVTTGCGRVSPVQSSGLTVDAKGGTGNKLGSGYTGTGSGGLLQAGVGTVRGRVVNAASQQGLAGAVVVIEPGNVRVTADASGTFRAAGISSGTYTFKAMLTGMQQLTTNGVVVEANKEAEVPDITMVPGNGPSGITSITYVQEKEMGRAGEPPATLIAPVGVAVRGRDVLALDLNNSAGVKTGVIRQYDGESGKFVGKFGDYSKWLGMNLMRNTVKAIALDNQGRAVVLDGAKHLWRFDTDGDKDKALDIDVENGTDLAINATSGNIFVSHAGGITRYNSEGAGGQALGTLGEVRAVAAYKDEVWALTGNKVQKLAADGGMVLEFGPGGSDQAGTFNDATDMAVDPRNGNLVVVDKGLKSVYVYDAVGTLIGKVGQGVFDAPIAAAVDATGRVYVVDQGKKKVYKFLPSSMS